MPNPSQVTAQNINTELGVPTTSNIPMSNNWLKNVACVDVTSNSNINYGKVRWGINFPGRDVVVNESLGSNSAKYDVANSLDVYASDFRVVYDSFSVVQASAQIQFFSNGTLAVTGTSTQFAGHTFNRTWLTSGVNSDYTAQFLLLSGALGGSSSATNTDLVLSSDRTWLVVTPMLFGSGGDQANTVQASGNLIIKSGGTTLIERPVSLYAQAGFGPLTP